MISQYAYHWVLVAHSVFRWVVLIAGFVTVVNAALGLGARQPWAPEGPRLGRLFSIAVDVQVLMGVALYFILSPLTTVVARASGARLPSGSDAHFIASVHPALMFTALIMVHVAAMIVRRGRGDAAHQRRALIFYGATLALLFIGVPWWRPWLRW